MEQARADIRDLQRERDDLQAQLLAASVERGRSLLADEPSLADELMNGGGDSQQVNASVNRETTRLWAISGSGRVVTEWSLCANFVMGSQDQQFWSITPSKPKLFSTICQRVQYNFDIRRMYRSARV